MKKKKLGNTKLLIIAVVMTFVVMFGTTYAWLRLTKTSTIENKITAGNLDLVLDEGENITLKNEVPRSYRQGMETKEYTFTITNNSSVSNYKLSLADLEKYTNEDGNEIVIADENRIDDAKIRYILLKDGEVATADKSKILTDRVIDSGTIKKGQTITYSLRLWIDSRAEKEVMGKVFNARLSLVAEQTSEVTPVANKLCKRATTLHTEKCSQTSTSAYCSGDGYALNDTITYGNLGTTGALISGDAFDCDVNGDGVYDSATERFYYVSDMTNGVTTDANTAVLIYYNNVSGGVASNSTTYAYDESGSNNNGPITVIKQLPTIAQWKNAGLTNTIRVITNENGENTTSAGNLPTAFSYEGYVARLLTAQEVSTGCKITVGSYILGELSTKCKYLMENTDYSFNNLPVRGFWLETPNSTSTNFVFGANSSPRLVAGFIANFSGNTGAGVRPAIEVAKTNIEY